MDFLGRPAALTRFSSRLARLDHAFLKDRLRGALAYDRIAGYFRSSIFEVAGEELAAIGRVRVVCNSDLNPKDLRASQDVRSAAMLERMWSDGDGNSVALDSLMRGDRYAALKAMLQSKDGNGAPRVEIRVVDRVQAPLLHGKAGIVTLADGRKTCFMGSVNETSHAWRDHYELLWEDGSDEGVAWTQAEFDFLWSMSVPMPNAVIREIERRAERVEIRLEDCPAWDVGGVTDLPRAALAESPLARAGERLQPWQKAFVAEFLRHRDLYGKARLLLADEVGVGKTLSMATAALLTVLMGDGPALILAPSTLLQQWQIELWDRLGIPSARWWSTKKSWVDHLGHIVRTNGPADIVRCPYRVAIVSTGLIVHGWDNFRHDWRNEAAPLLDKRARPGEDNYGIVVLDEAHRARSAEDRRTGERNDNRLLAFMLRIAARARHVVLGTATPMQTDPLDLWDLMRVLAVSADFVLGSQMSRWRNDPRGALDLVTGRVRPRTMEDAWPWVSNPLPHQSEHTVFDHARGDLGLSKSDFNAGARSHIELDADFAREELQALLMSEQGGIAFLQTHNPVVRHVILRRRKALEDANLLKRVAVEVHPPAMESDRMTRAFFDATGRAVETPPELREAFEVAEEFTAALMSRNKGAGFMRSLLLQRICSSTRAGLTTARALAGPNPEQDEAILDGLDDDDEMEEIKAAVSEPSADERGALMRLTRLLEVAEAVGGDPKLDVVKHYLGARGWLALGCIVFSQYFDTADWVARRLTEEFPEEAIALYAGSGKSGVFRAGKFVSAERDVIKRAVRERELRLVIATDAACEGLNLQTLGTLIDVDLPWNPSRLEQRIGRIKRFGQTRDVVDMLNLVYEGSRDQAIYEKLSERMRDKYDLFGQLPDTLSDDWIEDEQALDRELLKFVEGRQRANAFDIRWGSTATGLSLSAVDRSWQDGWERCSQVLSRRDVEKALVVSW